MSNDSSFWLVGFGNKGNNALVVIGPLISEGKMMKFSGKSTNALSASKYLHTRSYSIARICSTSIRPTGGERNGHVRIMFPLKHLGEILRG